MQKTITQNKQTQFLGIKAIVFDFDNTLILDEKTRRGSEELKDEAWPKVFSEYGSDLIVFHYERAKKKTIGGKADRKDVFEEICRNLGIPEAEIPAEIVRRSAHFNRLLQEGIKKIGISPQAREALVNLSQRMPLYINTATPVEYLLESLNLLGLVYVFKAVYGRPGTKLENMRAIISAESVSSGEILFVDDQEASWAISQEIGCRFVGMHTARNAWRKESQPFPVVRSIEELLRLT